MILLSFANKPLLPSSAVAHSCYNMVTCCKHIENGFIIFWQVFDKCKYILQLGMSHCCLIAVCECGGTTYVLMMSSETHKRPWACQMGSATSSL